MRGVPESSHRVFQFDDYELDEGTNELRRAGCPVVIQPKPLQLLTELLRHQGRVVAKDELLERLWSGLSVSESALTSALRDLRRVLGQDGGAGPRRRIETVRGRGYRFGAPVAVRFQAAGPAAPANARADLVASPCFVEREREMERLRLALDAVRGGRTRLVFLVGEPGIGKTRIAEEFAREALEWGVSTHFGRCQETQTALPFWPFTELLRSCLAGVPAARVLDTLGPIGADAVPVLLPELATERDVSAGSHRGMELAAHRMAGLFDSAARLLRWVADETPRVLVLEDAHWADEGSLRLLRFLVQSLTEAPLLLLVTYRDVELEASHPLRSTLGAIAHVDHADSIHLGGLGSAAIARILESHTDVTAAAPLVESVHAATGGNPFFVNEMARILARRGPVDPSADPSALPVPGRVRDALLLRLSRRSQACQELLRVASVIGSEFDVELAARVVEPDREALVDALSEGEAAGLIRREPKGVLRHAFTHALVREALIDSLTGTERTRLHARIGAALEELAGPCHERLEEIAHHYHEAAHAGFSAKAIEYAERAAERATRLLAFEEAARHLRRALDLLPAGERSANERRCALLVRQAEMRVAALAAPTEILEIYEEAVALARALGSGALLAAAVDAYASYVLGSWVPAVAQVRMPHSLFGQSGPALARVLSDPKMACRRIRPLLEEALARLGDERPELRAYVLFRLAAVAGFSGRDDEARAFTARASDLAAGLPDPRARIEMLLVRWYGTRSPKRGEQRFALAEQMVQLGRELGSELCEVTGHICHACACMEAGDMEGALAALAFVENDRRVKGLQFDALQVFEVMHCTATGRFEEAEKHAWESYRIAKQIQYGRARAMIRLRAQIWLVRIFQGRAKDMLDAIEVSATQNGPLVEVYLARALVDLDCPREARGHLATFMQGMDALPKDENWLGAVAIAADVAALTRSLDSAAALYDELLPYEGRIVMTAWFVLCLGSISRVLGLLAAALDRRDEAVRHLEEALVQNRRLGSEPWIAQTQLDYARVLASGGGRADVERAAALIEQAIPTARRLGMRRLLERAEQAQDAVRRALA